MLRYKCDFFVFSLNSLMKISSRTLFLYFSTTCWKNVVLGETSKTFDWKSLKNQFLHENFLLTIKCGNIRIFIHIICFNEIENFISDKFHFLVHKFSCREGSHFTSKFCSTLSLPLNKIEIRIWRKRRFQCFWEFFKRSVMKWEWNKGLNFMGTELSVEGERVFKKVFPNALKLSMNVTAISSSFYFWIIRWMYRRSRTN